MAKLGENAKAAKESFWESALRSLRNPEGTWRILRLKDSETWKEN
jgi:hypothetical protein